MLFQDFFITHKAEVLFVYGLAFFMMGFAIALQPKNFSNIPLAKSLKYLAFFGIFHGFVEWGMMFLAFQRDYVTVGTIRHIILFKTILNSFSFMFLFMFGTSLLSETKQKWSRILYIPVAIFGLWLVLLILSNIFYYDEFRPWMNASNTWSRYLLAFPGSIVSGYAIYLQIPQLIRNRFGTSISIIKKFSIVFFAYAIAGGLIVPKTSFFPANLINSDAFFALTGIPIYLFRATCGVFMAYYSVHILRIFKREIELELDQAQVLNSIYNERERFSRDLHDGVVQSVYGVGLYLENASMTIDKNPEKAKSHIHVATKKLDDVIIQMRNYINDLRGQSNNKSNILLTSLYEIIHDFKSYSGIAVDFSHDPKVAEHPFPEKTANNIKLIAFELLTNVIKHASASNVKIKLKDTDAAIMLIISDNGKGFNEKNHKRRASNGYHQGLNNVKERVKMFGGTIMINSKLGQGTTIEILIPRGDE